MPIYPWSETTLNYMMMVERYPYLKEEVDGLIPGYEISSLLYRNLLGRQLPLVLWRWFVGLLSPKRKKKKDKRKRKRRSQFIRYFYG